MPDAALYTVKIGGSFVTAQAGTLNIVGAVGQRSTGSVTVKSALGVSYAYGTVMQVYDETSTLAYAGYVTQDKAYRDPGARQGSGWLLHDLQLMDNCYRADKRMAFYTTLNRSAGLIVADLITQYLAAEGVTYSAATVATGPTITEVIWNGKQVSQCLDYLATQAGYWWNIDKHGVLFFLPYGGLPAPWTLDGTQVDVMQNLSVVFGNTRYVNRQYTRGAYAQTGAQTETFHGNSLTRAFTLPFEVASTSVTGASAISITLNGAAQSVGSKGDVGDQFYAAIGDAVVAQDPAQPVLTSGDTLVVSYHGRYPVLALAADAGQISTQKSLEGGGTGYVEALYADTKVHTQQAAFQIASGLLAHYGQEMTVLEFDTLVNGLADGQMLTVNLADFGLSGAQMLISGVTISDQRDGINIWFHVTAVGSPYDVAHWQSFFQAMMNQQADPSELTDTADGSTLALILPAALTLHLRATGSFSTTTCALFPMTFPYTLC
jgi:hypothetical protein